MYAKLLPLLITSAVSISKLDVLQRLDSIFRREEVVIKDRSENWKRGERVSVVQLPDAIVKLYKK